MTHLGYLRKQNNFKVTILLEIFLKLMHVSYIIPKGQIARFGNMEVFENRSQLMIRFTLHLTNYVYVLTVDVNSDLVYVNTFLEKYSTYREQYQ